MKQTAVEWLYRWFNDNPEATIKEGIEAFEQALAMEKEQMFELWNGGINCTEEGGKSFDQYYNKTYKPNKS